MAQIQTLKDRGTGKTVYPVTTSKAVFDDNGVDLDTLLEKQKQSTENALKEYAKRTEVTQGLDTKQDKLSTTTDLHITDDNIIGLTEAAKVKLFDDMWEAAYGTVIVSGVTYGCNGIDDLTYQEAVGIYQRYSKRKGADYSHMFFASLMRALLPIWIPNASPLDLSCMFQSSANLTKIVFFSNITPCIISANNLFATFHTCSSLREIDGILDVSGITGFSFTFVWCVALEEVRLRRLKANIDLSYCAKLSLASVEYMVANATNTAAIVITVHADVYAKLTGDTTNAAAAALTAEELAQWQQVCLDANAKNIAFATA